MKYCKRCGRILRSKRSKKRGMGEWCYIKYLKEKKKPNNMLKRLEELEKFKREHEHTLQSYRAPIPVPPVINNNGNNQESS